MRWMFWLPTLAFACFATLSHAQRAWQPHSNVEVIVQSAAGRASDRSARVAQKILAAIPGFPSVTVTNKPGAGGRIALGAVKTRVGFEDIIYYAPGQKARTNSVLVKKMVQLVEAMGCEVMSIAEAHELYGAK